MNKEQIEEVKNEAKILSYLNSKFVVRYLESFVLNNSLNIVMEYCDGGDLSIYLRDFLKTGKFLPEEKIWKFFIQICLGINYIHNKKILHRDLKTMNIFLMKDEKVRIGDLGVAKVLNQNSFANTFVGTPYYLSPEICEEKPYNEKSDIWALGCILYEMATYKHPFNASNQGALIIKILTGNYESIQNKEYSNDLRKMVNMLLEKIYLKRPSIKEVLKNPSKYLLFIFVLVFFLKTFLNLLKIKLYTIYNIFNYFIVIIKKIKQYNLEEFFQDEICEFYQINVIDSPFNMNLNNIIFSNASNKNQALPYDNAKPSSGFALEKQQLHQQSKILLKNKDLKSKIE